MFHTLLRFVWMPCVLVLSSATFSVALDNPDTTLRAVQPRSVDAVHPAGPSPTGLSTRGSSANGLRLSEDDVTIRISSSEVPIVVYNKQSPPVPEGMKRVYHRSGFLHPVCSPAGKTVTATFPFDHPHQHGIFSAWVRTTYRDRAIDFWNLAGGTGRVLHQRVVSTFANDRATGFEVDLVHRAQQPPVVDILRERWKISVYPTNGTHHCFDLETTQKAVTDAPLIVNQFHYGGIAVRGPVRWLQARDGDLQKGDDVVHEPSSFLNDLGSDRKKGNHEHARWVCLTGRIDAAPVSIAMLCRAENFRAPQAARLHPTKPYFCYAPCVDDAFEIDKGHPFVARYRFLVTDAEADTDWLDEQWQSWCGE